MAEMETPNPLSGNARREDLTELRGVRELPLGEPPAGPPKYNLSQGSSNL